MVDTVRSVLPNLPRSRRRCASLVIDNSTRSIALSRMRAKFWGKILFGRKQQAHPRGDDRERITQARQAAEALSAKPQSGTPSVSEVGPTAKTPRKQRADD